MELEHQAELPCKQSVYISDLPEELTEYIFFHLSPYRDLQAAKLVCRQWHRLVLGVIRQLQQNFHDAVAGSQVLWTKLLPGDSPSITERYSHCACYYDKSLYVFGGRASTNTTFNDLWRFNLASRQWIRPLAMGTYPSPKAYASMVVYKDSLILFGGWSHPTPSPLHQAACFFNELHIYTPLTNRWSYVTSRNMPKRVAGHSACVVKDSMVMFGGSHFPGVGSNDVWIFDFNERDWYKKKINGPKPSPRYGQSQIALTDTHVLILGGCGGPNQIFNDVWMLILESDNLHWEQIRVIQPVNSAPQLWCHPACKVNDMVIFLSKPTKSMKLIPPSLPKWSQLRGHRTWEHSQSSTWPHPQPTSSRSNLTSIQHTGHKQFAQVLVSTSADDENNDNHEGSRLQEGMDTQCGLSTPSNLSSSVRSHPDPHHDAAASAHLQEQLQHKMQCTANFEYGFSDNSDKRLINSSAHSNGESSSLARPMDHHDSTAGRHLLAVGGTAMASTGFIGAEAAASALPNFIPASRPILPSIRPNRLKQLEMLCRYEEKIKKQNQQRHQPASGVLRNRYHHQKAAAGNGNSCTNSNTATGTASIPKEPRSLMHLHNLDISKAISEKTVTWQAVRKNISDSIPEEAIFYSLVEGRGELIMFGGILRDINSMQRGIPIKPHVVSNNLYVLSSPRPTF